MSGNEANPFTAADNRAIRDVLDAHEVRVAVLFGSATEHSEPADIDIAVEFDSWRPGDDGYASAYLTLQDALENAVGEPIDLVDIHAADESFLAVALENGTHLYGSRQRYAELKAEVADAYPSTTDARQRVTAAARRLREQS